MRPMIWPWDAAQRSSTHMAVLNFDIQSVPLANGDEAEGGVPQRID